METWHGSEARYWSVLLKRFNVYQGSYDFHWAQSRNMNGNQQTQKEPSMSRYSKNNIWSMQANMTGKKSSKVTSLRGLTYYTVYTPLQLYQNLHGKIFQAQANETARLQWHDQCSISAKNPCASNTRWSSAQSLNSPKSRHCRGKPAPKNPLTVSTAGSILESAEHRIPCLR